MQVTALHEQAYTILPAVLCMKEASTDMTRASTNENSDLRLPVAN